MELLAAVVTVSPLLPPLLNDWSILSARDVGGAGEFIDPNIPRLPPMIFDVLLGRTASAVEEDGVLYSRGVTMD